MRRHVVGIVGGAVAGSEAAALCVARGARVVVIEQGARPYGKIEDGLPRWHLKLREQEYARIDANLSHDDVRFVPRTRVGDEVGFEELRGMGFSAIILANGAWRDRPLPIPGVDQYVGRGLIYQNALVQWFNHAHEPGYDGEQVDVPEGAAVVGGGLASIDVSKILSLVTHARALRALGHEVDEVELESRGIPAWCEARGVELPAVARPTLFYRREMEDMPLASAPEGADEAVEQKIRAARGKIMRRTMERYLVEFEGLRTPVEAIEEDGQLVGMIFAETRIEGGRVVMTDERHAVSAPLTVSSIGSIPERIDDLPMRGELYDFADWETGAVTGLAGVFGLGNVLTGKGNIKDSRANARQVASGLLETFLELADPGLALHAAAREAAKPVVAAALAEPKATEAEQHHVDQFVEKRWDAIGYPRVYEEWAARHRTPR